MCEIIVRWFYFAFLHDSGLKHIMSNHGESTAAVYRRLFQVRESSGEVDKRLQGSDNIVYPPEILATVHEHYPDVQAGRRDAEFYNSDAKVYKITWMSSGQASKACKMCAVQVKKPYKLQQV